LGGYLLADLHGNIAAAVSAGSSPALLSAYRYDAYGETCGSWSADSGSLSVPWRFQGRLLESISGTTTDLYDFGARSYDPSLGAFTSFDSVAGSAVNPLTLNRYLYANANPATLVDPDGHLACRLDREDCDQLAKVKATTTTPPHDKPVCVKDPSSEQCAQWKLHVSFQLAHAQWEADWHYCHDNDDEHILACYANPALYDYVTIGGVFGGCGGFMRAFGCVLPLWDPTDAIDPYHVATGFGNVPIAVLLVLPTGPEERPAMAIDLGIAEDQMARLITTDARLTESEAMDMFASSGKLTPAENATRHFNKLEDGVSHGAGLGFETAGAYALGARRFLSDALTYQKPIMVTKEGNALKLTVFDPETRELGGYLVNADGSVSTLSYYQLTRTDLPPAFTDPTAWNVWK
jgi:RHS repeat-associated protein